VMNDSCLCLCKRGKKGRESLTETRRFAKVDFEVICIEQSFSNQLESFDPIRRPGDYM
jgi:hypothetical protein